MTEQPARPTRRFGGPTWSDALVDGVVMGTYIGVVSAALGWWIERWLP